jgi:hypothetical protein
MSSQDRNLGFWVSWEVGEGFNPVPPTWRMWSLQPYQKMVIASHLRNLNRQEGAAKRGWHNPGDLPAPLDFQEVEEYWKPWHPNEQWNPIDPNWRTWELTAHQKQELVVYLYKLHFKIAASVTEYEQEQRRQRENAPEKRKGIPDGPKVSEYEPKRAKRSFRVQAVKAVSMFEQKRAAHIAENECELNRLMADVPDE